MLIPPILLPRKQLLIRARFEDLVPLGLEAITYLPSPLLTAVDIIAGIFQSIGKSGGILDPQAREKLVIMQKGVERPQGKVFVRRPEFDGDITFKNVAFSYPEAAKASLSGVSFHIKSGEHVGIIGKVGSGKTSIIKLIVGLYDANEGSIAIDNIDINQIDPADLRHHIGYLSQEVELIRGSIRDNLAYKDLQINDEKLIQAATVSGVDLFVNKLAQGFDTDVGEHGGLLSGGQRQSIGLGRALLLDEPILILDEPTNSFDNTTESIVKKRLFDYSRDKTLVLVTHKAPMLDLVERLIVVDDGRIVMDGPKQDVLNAIKGGKHAQ